MGFQGNVGFSYAQDHMGEAALNAVDTVMSFTSILDHLGFLGDNVILSVLALNSTIIEAIPSPQKISGHQTCLKDVIGVSSSAANVQDGLRSLDNVIDGLPNMLAINRTLGDLLASVNALPDLNEMADRVDTLNRTINSMPPMAPLKNDLNSLNDTLGSFGIVSVIEAQILTMKDRLEELDTSKVKQKLEGFDNFWDELPVRPPPPIPISISIPHRLCTGSRLAIR